MSDSNAGQPAPDPAPPPPPLAGTAPAGPVRKLTVKQQQAYDLRMAGKTRAEGAVAMGISKSVYSKTLQAAYRKLGIFFKEPGGTKEPGATKSHSAEIRRPEVAAAALEAAADPVAETQKAALERVNQQLQAAGVPDRVSDALLRRLRTKYANTVFAARELRTAEILEMLGKKIDLAAFYLDDKVMSEASARDIMLGLGVLIEKRNLLRGEPTAIISDHERKKLHELAPALLAEIKRRGLTIEGQVLEKSVAPA